MGTVGFDANAQAAWDGSQGYGSASVVIAIIDSGVDVGHPDLNQVAGYDYGDNDSNPDDNSAEPGHGTACAGVAAAIANNGLGAVGHRRRLQHHAAEGRQQRRLDVLLGHRQNAHLPRGRQRRRHHQHEPGRRHQQRLGHRRGHPVRLQRGLTILAATGNENASTISYPAINAYVIGVGAASPCGERKRSSSSSTEVNPGVNTDPNGYTCDGERWWGSNYGSTTQDAAGAVDILAPTILPTTDIQGSRRLRLAATTAASSTAPAAPRPTRRACAALIKSPEPDLDPGPDPRPARRHGPGRDQRRVRLRLGPLQRLRHGRRRGGRRRRRSGRRSAGGGLHRLAHQRRPAR